MRSPHTAQREADAGFFEDWSAWAGIVFPDPRAGHYLVRPGGMTAIDIVMRIPGVKRQAHSRYHLPSGDYLVPAASWRALRRTLPTLARLAREGRRADDAERARVRREAEKEAAAMAKALTGGAQTLHDKLNAIADLSLTERRALTAWERDFIGPLVDRCNREAGDIQVSDKQRAIIDRIYAALGSRPRP